MKLPLLIKRQENMNQYWSSR